MDEANRIKSVYQRYRASKVCRAQWDGELSGNKYIFSRREEVLVEILKHEGFFPIHDRKILDIGCGGGTTLAGFLTWGAKPENLYGVDLIPERIEDARSRYPAFTFYCADAEHLEFPDFSFDMIIIFTVFSSILDDSMAKKIAGEAMRVLKTGGLIIIYDVRYPNLFNPFVRALTKQLVRKYFSGYTRLSFTALTLIPTLARFLGPLSYRLCYMLEKISLLRSHYITVIQK
ncbi:MAG: class I SAM-dependent methyltransferase [Candidatus Omnitrophota bacterium]|nr:class I SAM-dependent methyltransferase [Candidatus Omnitrophota bacterium]